MDPQSIEAFSAEGGDEGGMDVEDGAGEAGDEVRGENPQKAQNNEWKYTAAGGGGQGEPLESPREVECERIPELNGDKLS